MIPLTKLDPTAFAPLRLSEILHGEPAYQPLIEDGVQVSKEPLLDLIPDATVKHVPDLKAKPDLSFPSVLLVDFSLSSDLIPTSDPVSDFMPTYPVKPSPHMTQQFNQFISEAQPKLVPQNAPSGALHEPESDVVSLDEETLTRSVSALAPQESEVDLPLVDLQLSAPAVDTSCDSETKVVPTCIGDLCASATVLDTVIDQPQSILLLSPLVGLEEPVLVPAVDQQQSYSSCSLIGEAGFQLEFATPASLQHVPGFLPQLDPPPVPMFPSPVMSQQLEIDLTPTDESDVAPQTDTALPVNGQPVDELNLSGELLAEEEAKEESALPEEVPSTCPS